MTSLNHLVTAGKVLYLGVSDTPAWIVSRANQCTSHILRLSNTGSLTNEPNQTPETMASAPSPSTKANGMPQSAISSAISSQW